MLRIPRKRKKKKKTSRSKGFHLSCVLSDFVVDRLREFPATTVADDCELAFWRNTAGSKEFAEHLYPAKRDEVAQLLADGSRFAPVLDDPMEASAMHFLKVMRGIPNEMKLSIEKAVGYRGMDLQTTVDMSEHYASLNKKAKASSASARKINAIGR